VKRNATAKAAQTSAHKFILTPLRSQKSSTDASNLCADSVEEPPLPEHRIRGPGGGRRRLEVNDPGLVELLESLVEPLTFPDPSAPRAFPYDVYDLARNTDFVNVGADHDTAAFACWSWDLALVVRKSHNQHGNANGGNSPRLGHRRLSGVALTSRALSGPG